MYQDRLTQAQRIRLEAFAQAVATSHARMSRGGPSMSADELVRTAKTIEEYVAGDGTDFVDVEIDDEPSPPGALALLRRLVKHETDPCTLDHHGYCQTHSLHEGPCPIPLARQLLGMERP